MDVLTGLVKRFDIEIKAGLWVRVTPLSSYTKALLLNEARESVPEFDVEPFRKAIAGAKGDTFIDSKMPEYQRLERQRIQKIDMYMMDRIMSMCVEIMDSDKQIIAKETILNMYAGEVVRLRSAGVNFIPDGDWHAVVRYVLLDNPMAFKRIMDAINDHMPLTGEEVMNAGFRTLQYPLAGESPAESEAGTTASGVPEQSEAEQPA